MPHGNAFRSYFWSILNKTTLLNTGTGARLQQQQQMATSAAAAAGDGGAATTNSTAQRMTAGIIVIGDEILKGSTMDSNSHYLCRHLHNRGVLVKKISVIGDHVPEIACEVRKFSGDFDIVFTTGGIGPTHDDKTFEGLASAFGEELTTSEELKAVVEIFLRKTKLRNVHEAVEKFCRLPRSAQLIWGSQRPPANPDQLTNFPSVQIHNVIALPGVPRFCEQSFELLEEHLFPTPKMSAFFSKDIYLRKNEIHLQRRLTQIADKHTPQGVSIGSYPVMGHSYFKTRLSVDSNSAEAGQAAVEELNREFSDWIVNYDPQPWENCAHKLEKFREQQSSKEFADKIDDAVQTIDQILDKYSLDKIALSFNGGKDCTLLLHLFRASVDRKHGKQTPIEGFFIEGDDEFPKVVTFVRNVSKSYNLTIFEVPGTMKAGLARLKSERPNVVAVLMGSRSTDPKACHMKSKCEWTDADWPSFIRVCPLLDWSYADIWRALRGLCIPYCPLYDQGYSSLGERSKTAKNPHLKDKSREDRYLPAYMLEDGNLERAFREERPPDSSSSK